MAALIAAHLEKDASNGPHFSRLVVAFSHLANGGISQIQPAHRAASALVLAQTTNSGSTVTRSVLGTSNGVRPQH